jgi:hypothetical protein
MNIMQWLATDIWAQDPLYPSVPLDNFWTKWNNFMELDVNIMQHRLSNLQI